jgi:predicted O-methyltransferase YrrM
VSESGQAGWNAVDAFIQDHLLGRDAVLDSALEANAQAGLPPIDVSATQGKMLCLFARMMGVSRILEIGTLGGYSTIWLARALPEYGRIVTFEIDPKHAEVAQANIDRAGFSAMVDIRVGPALDLLAQMQAADEGPFDLVFIDADKQNNANYVKAALAMSRNGTAIIVDNVVREGRVADLRQTDPMIEGTRSLYEMISAEPRLNATVVQTVGTKGWDGFLLALVD